MTFSSDDASITAIAATPPADPASLVGKTIGRLQIRGFLGAGNMGEVYLAFDAKLEREVAVKMVRGHATEKGRRRLAREARVLCQLDHPNICRLYELIEKPELDVLVLERIHGRSLDQIPPRTVPLKERLRIAEGIAEALVAAHEKGVIHRDLKPANVMLTDRGEVKVLDFGIAKSEGDSGRQDETLGRQGTFAYMSPEQVRGEQETAAVDIFSFGLVLQELLTGHPAYPRDLPWVQLLARVSRGETEPFFTTFDPELEHLLRRMLAHPPEARPSAVEVVEHLRQLRDRPRRQRQRWLLATALAILFAGGAKYTVDLQREQKAALGAVREAEALSTFLGGLLAIDGSEGAPGAVTADTPLRTLLDRAAARVDAQAPVGQPEVRSRLLLMVGSLYRQVGDPVNARPRLEEAVALRRGLAAGDRLGLARTLEELARLEIDVGRAAEAARLLREAIPLLEAQQGAEDASQAARRQLAAIERTTATTMHEN
jgi:hypothetical protein